MIDMKTLMVAALVMVGCGPMSETGADMVDQGNPVGDMAKGGGDMAKSVKTCAWNLAAPVVTNGSTALVPMAEGRATQCEMQSNQWLLSINRADGSVDDFYVFPSKTTPTGVDVFYRLTLNGSALPEITCENWTGSAQITTSSTGSTLTTNLHCVEKNAGHFYWNMDMAPPPTDWTGTITFPN